MKKLIVRLLLFLTVPFSIITILAALYIHRDVHLDFGRYGNYSWKYYYQSLGDLSTKKLLQSPVAYNSFIFGSSRTTGLYACYLQTRIEGSRFFHYANWDESIGGIAAKLNLLDSLGYNIDHVIMYFDTDNTFAGDGKCKSYDHYLLTGENKYAYYYNHFRNFVFSTDRNRFRILFGLKPADAVVPNWKSDPVTNDCRYVCSDSLLSHYGEIPRDKAYIQRIDSLKKCGFLYERSKIQLFKKKQISKGEVRSLQNIRKILDKHHSDYYVFITPLYDQMKFHPSDMVVIKNVLGDHVFDFSGINGITDNQYNYADRKHFAPYISKMIIDLVIGNTYAENIPDQGKSVN